MSDSGGIGSVISEAVQAVVEPVKDEVGAAIEAGVQSVLGTGPAAQDPATDAVADAKKADEEKQKAEAKWVIEKNRQLDAQLRAVRQKNAEDAQKAQESIQQEEQVKQYKVVDKTQKRDAMARQVQEAKTRSETRKGVGG